MDLAYKGLGDIDPPHSRAVNTTPSTCFAMCALNGCCNRFQFQIILCVGFVGCCVSEDRFVGWMFRSGLIGDVENVRLADLHPSIVIGFFGGGLLLTWRGICVRCLYACNAAVQDR